MHSTVSHLHRAWPAFGLVLTLLQAAACADSGKLLLTGGVSSIDGAAGGGLTPWAVTGSYATNGQVGATAFATRVKTQDYALNVAGAAASYGDRVEISLARQEFDTGPTGPALGAPGVRLKQDIVGLKLRVFGEAVLDSDTLLPQVAVGVEVKNADAGALAATLSSLGARTRGTDAYVSATKLNPSALGAGLKEDDWSDVFIAWAPNKNVSLTLAHVELGRIVPAVVTRRQRGAYLSAQLAF